jgi:hypothetical protein
MPSRDLQGDSKVVVALNANTTVSSVAVNGVIIDTHGFDSAMFVIQSATITDGTSYTPSLTVGDAANLSDGATAPADALVGTPAGGAFAATDDNAVKRISYRGGKRYARLTLTPVGATTGGVFAAVAVLGHARLGPQAQ